MISNAKQQKAKVPEDETSCIRSIVLIAQRCMLTNAQSGLAKHIILTTAVGALTSSNQTYQRLVGILRRLVILFRENVHNMLRASIPESQTAKFMRHRSLSLPIPQKEEEEHRVRLLERQQQSETVTYEGLMQYTTSSNTRTNWQEYQQLTAANVLFAVLLDTTPVSFISAKQQKRS